MILNMIGVISKTSISADVSIKEALHKLDESGKAILFVCDKDNALLGSLTDGDIRRKILDSGDLQEKVSSCFNPNPTFLRQGDYNSDQVRELMISRTIEVIPVVDADKRIVDVLFWADVFGEGSIIPKTINVPVVIMAGGKGERLGPFTKIFPKSLVPIGEKPIIEIIIDKFRQYNVCQFYVTLNYKGDMIKVYLDSIPRDYKLNYIWEKEFLGTAGSLKLLASKLESTFIVSNSDIIVDLDYRDLVNFHRDNDNVFTVVGSIQHHRIPYGTINFEKDGRIRTIQEKPEFDLTVNTGVYVLSKKVLEFIPEAKPFDMTDLIQILLEDKQNVGVYPVSQKSYVDVGQWEEYKKAMDKLQFFK